MSIQWTLVAGILYFEIGLVILLLLPFLKPRTWHKFFKSRFLRSIENQANLYFMVFIVILVLLFMDSIREMSKYSSNFESDSHSSRHVDAELQHSMKLFRAQRNFYIAGFALFLFLVIRRLITLMSAMAQLDIRAEAIEKQAKGASAAARAAMSAASESADGDKKASSGQQSEKDKQLADENKKLKEEVSKLKATHEAALSQAKNVSAEYDRLMQEHQKLQKKQKIAAGDSKKDD